MRKGISRFIIVSLITVLFLSVSVFAPIKVDAATTGGWHLVETKYHISPNDVTIKGEIQNRVMGTTSGYILDKYTAEGSEGDMIFTHSRVDNNGKPIAHITHQVVWDTPPTYLAPNEKTGFNLETKTISSNSWGSPQINANFDSAGIKPGSGTVSSMSFKSKEGEAYIKDKKVYFESSKVIHESRPGDKKAIILNLGHLYGYTYTYEWKEGAVPTPPINSGSTKDLSGEWEINANNCKGKINITNQQESVFTGTVNIDRGNTESLTNGSLKVDTVSFTRQWPNSSLNQVYTGILTIEAGKMTMKGTFTQYGSNSTWSWSATKAIASAPSTPTAPVGSGAEPFESGSRIMWQPANGLGYRLFRSTSQGSLGISVTDFYITSTSYADVNVESDTTYYYTVKPVLAEARPFEGIDEKLGEAIATFVVKTGSQIYKPGNYKHFIMLKLESPNMSVDGINQEVDPGRGTAPLVIAGRTMVPIRAVVEAMGGKVDWDGGTQKITLTARGNTVEMWMGKTDIKINGVSKKMDVAPTSKNDRTFVPVRFAAENLNSKVDWINSTKEAIIVYEE